MSSKKIIFIIILALVISALVIFFVPLRSTENKQGENIVGGIDIMNEPRNTQVGTTTGIISVSKSNETKSYSHSDPDFSLQFPTALSSSVSEDEDGSLTIVFKKSGEKTGFQLFISPYDVKTKNLYDVIRQAFPELEIEGVQEVVIGSGVHGLVFWSYDPTIGKTRELWFVRDGYIYEATTYAEFDILLGEVFSTLK